MTKALLIGEAWGRNEDDFKHAFIGQSGQELARMGGEADLFPPLLRQCKYCQKLVSFGRCENCGVFNGVSFLEMVHFWTKVRNHGIAVSNVFDRRPGIIGENVSESTRNLPREKQDLILNNIELLFGNKTEPESDLSFGPYRRGSKMFYVLKQHSHHVQRLYDEIETLRPNILVLLGNTACWAVLGQVKISDLRGTVQDTKFGIKAIPTYHPAALRDWSLRPIIVSDLKKSTKESQTPHLSRNKLWLEAQNSTLTDIENWFKTPTHRYSCDIESGFVLFSKTELEQMKKYAPKARSILAQLISMVGFARSEDQGLIIQFITRDETNGKLVSYWPTQSHEVEAWQWVQHGLSTGAELVFQNGMYDVNRLLCSGIRPRNMIHDTMLRSHSMWAEMRKGLGFLNSLWGDYSAWKTMYGKGMESLKRDD